MGVHLHSFGASGGVVWQPWSAAMSTFEKDCANEEEAVAARTTGLHSKADFAKLASSTAPAPESEKQEVKKKKKKKKAGAVGAMSFDVEEGEDQEAEAAPRKKLCNPNVNSSFLQKKEWMSNEEKEELKRKENERLRAIEQEREEAGKRELTIEYCFTMRPIGGKDEIFHVSVDPEDSEVVVNEKPPRVFKGRKLVTTWGTTVERFCVDARDELGRHIAATEKKQLHAAGIMSQNLMMIDGSMICPEGRTFLELSEQKYTDGSPIFHFGQALDQNSKGDSVFHVCERHWYESNRFHFPQSQWELYDATKSYQNPNKSNQQKKTTGSQEFAQQYAAAKGAEEVFVYKDTSHRSMWQK